METTLSGQVLEKLKRFFWEPASPRPLAALRIGLCLLLLGQAFYFGRDLLELFGRSGIMQGELADYFSGLALPNIQWLQKKMFLIAGIDPDNTVRTVFVIYLASLSSLLLGWHTRVSTVIAWLTHFVLIVSGFVMVYGVDHFANIFLFFLIWMPCGADLSVDNLKSPVKKSSAARLSLRVLQLELCLVYLSSGIVKASGEQWWNGEAIWRAVNLPMGALIKMNWLAHYPFLAQLFCWGTLFIELGYVILIWPKETRRVFVTATVFMHLGIAFSLGLVTFGLEMSVLTATVFGMALD